MRKFLLFLTIMSLVSLLSAAERIQNQAYPILPQTPQTKISVFKNTRLPHTLKKPSNGFPGGLLFMEDFEPGSEWHRWTSDDLTDPRPQRGPSHWLLDTWEALGDSSWRMADTSLGTNGGYDNHWYQVLDTPPILVSDTTDTNLTFSFYHRFSVENPAGAPAPYDGWDAINVRVSTDSGLTWHVLEFDTYNISSDWAFGEPTQGMFEGVGIPGWGGDQLEWRKESISLKDYVEPLQPFMIRFAFASDMAYSTADGGPDMFGWEVDSITVASDDSLYFFNDGQKDGMTGKDNVYIPPLGGDLWHVATIENPLPVYASEFTPSGTHAAVLQNGGDVFDSTATYNPWMEDAYGTGPIALPDTTPIYLDFDHLPFFADPDEDLNSRDFFYVEARPIDSTEWEPVSISDDGGYYVYPEGFDRWINVSTFYGYPENMSPFDLSRFAGQDVYIRIRFHSDDDQPIGYGLLVDDFVIYSPIVTIPAPTGIKAVPVPEDTTIHVSWDFEEGKTYQVWRTTPGDAYIHLMGEVMDSVFTDTAVVPFQEYDYTLKAGIKYEGTSDFPRNDEGYILVAGAEIYPPTVVEFGYDDSTPDTTIVAPTNKLIYVKFTPKYYPVNLEGVNFFLDSTGVTRIAPIQIKVWTTNDTSGAPDSLFTFKTLQKADVKPGFNRMIFEKKMTIDSSMKSFYISVKRYGSGYKLGADTSEPIDGNTYVEESSGLVNVTDLDAMVHVLLDTSQVKTAVGIKEHRSFIADRFGLGNNYPNPFNPQTMIPFNVPVRAAGQHMTITVYNILGQKVATLFDGKAVPGTHYARWLGKNSSGKTVSSGIYLYQLKSKGITLTNRMLFIK